MEHDMETYGLSATTMGPRQPRVTIQDILDRRAKAGKLVALTAAYSDSDMFKGPSTDKPVAKRWDHYLTEESRRRVPGVLKAAARHISKPGLISLGGGLPCAENFPFESISMRIPVPPTFSSADTTLVGKYDIAGGLGEYDLSVALNYGQASGSAQLLRWVTEHTELVTPPPYADWRSCLTVGSTAALEQALRMLCDGGRGDALMTEAYSYATALETAAPLGVRVVGIPMDDQGLLPDKMDALLTTWDETAMGARKPHVLYTVPSGENPTGATQGEQRRRHVYAVAQKHDVYVLEDDPYYFLQMPAHVEGGAKHASPPFSVDHFLASLLPTLLSMDVDGRVMRMESFSKVVAPGARVGWITASEQMVDRFLRHSEVANQGPSGFSQVLLHRLLDVHWGHEGYLAWLMRLRDEYAGRRDVMLDACEAHLPRGVVTWTPPRAGMFLWLHVDHEKDTSHRSVLALEGAVYAACIDKGVLALPGSWFRAEPDREPDGLFFRVTFATATPEDMAEAVSRFGAAVRETLGVE